jgi:predicted glycoside hydrolase/deacetylase ChbG (UPF0249 family)
MASAWPRSTGPSGLVPIVHADDCGLSAGITDAIMACCDDGWLRRTSVVANGAGWAHAVEALRRRPHVGVALHVNLFEGAPLANPDELDLLVDRSGRFHRSFAALWVSGLAGASAARLRAQIRLELRRQIERFLDAFGERGPLRIDSHVHYHLLPVVLDALLELGAEYPLGAVRLPREPFNLAVRPTMVNVAKHVVLRALSRRAAPTLRARSIEIPAAFVGVLGTGAMTLAHVRSALRSLHRAGISGTVEILFHPGRARADEAWLWDDRPELRAIYLSAERDREAEVLRSGALGELLRSYGDAPTDHAPAAGHAEAIR